ncbi:hypothetical protein SNEBB_006942 [Seison nebaliae]|nr:hypothetical protein SNEBB_006942 [Seison nebaliae]
MKKSIILVYFLFQLFDKTKSSECFYCSTDTNPLCNFGKINHQTQHRVDKQQCKFGCSIFAESQRSFIRSCAFSQYDYNTCNKVAPDLNLGLPQFPFRYCCNNNRCNGAIRNRSSFLSLLFLIYSLIFLLSHLYKLIQRLRSKNKFFILMCGRGCFGGTCGKRYKRLVDNLYPSPKNRDMKIAKKTEVEKLLYYGDKHDEKLDRIANYLETKMRYYQRQGRSECVKISLDMLYDLMKQCSSHINMMIVPYFNMVRDLLESDKELLLYAMESFKKFCMLEENHSTQRGDYEFFIERFTQLSYYARDDDDDEKDLIRGRSLQVLDKLLKKMATTKIGGTIGQVWDAKYMDKVIPCILFNMQSINEPTTTRRSSVDPDIEKFRLSKADSIQSGIPLTVGERQPRADEIAIVFFRDLSSSCGYKWLKNILTPTLKFLDDNFLWKSFSDDEIDDMIIFLLQLHEGKFNKKRNPLFIEPFDDVAYTCLSNIFRKSKPDSIFSGTKVILDHIEAMVSNRKNRAVLIGCHILSSLNHIFCTRDEVAQNEINSVQVLMVIQKLLRHSIIRIKDQGKRKDHVLFQLFLTNLIARIFLFINYIDRTAAMQRILSDTRSYGDDDDVIVIEASFILSSFIVIENLLIGDHDKSSKILSSISFFQSSLCDLIMKLHLLSCKWIIIRLQSYKLLQCLSNRFIMSKSGEYSSELQKLSYKELNIKDEMVLNIYKNLHQNPPSNENKEMKESEITESPNRLLYAVVQKCLLYLSKRSSDLVYDSDNRENKQFHETILLITKHYDTSFDGEEDELWKMILFFTMTKASPFYFFGLLKTLLLTQDMLNDKINTYDVNRLAEAAPAMEGKKLSESSDSHSEPIKDILHIDSIQVSTDDLHLNAQSIAKVQNLIGNIIHLCAILINDNSLLAKIKEVMIIRQSLTWKAFLVKKDITLEEYQNLSPSSFFNTQTIHYAISKINSDKTKLYVKMFDTITNDYLAEEFRMKQIESANSTVEGIMALHSSKFNRPHTSNMEALHPNQMVPPFDFRIAISADEESNGSFNGYGCDAISLTNDNAHLMKSKVNNETFLGENAILPTNNKKTATIRGTPFSKMLEQNRNIQKETKEMYEKIIV